MKSNIVALVPARSGSKRIPGKNMKDFFGHPLIDYTIQVAKGAEFFDDIVVSSDNVNVGILAVKRGIGFVNRPAKLATDTSPDSEWITHALNELKKANRVYEYFAILRPTSPFRTVEMIKRARIGYRKGYWLKAMEPVKQHPGKMWDVDGGRTYPFYMDALHSLPTNAAPKIWVQNGSLEIRPTDNIEPTIFQPFLTEGLEGFDINDELDWILAEELVKRGMAKLPEVKA